MYRIFTKEKKPKEIFNVNMTKEDIEEYNIDIWVDHKDLKPDDYVVIYRKEPFLAPVYDDGEIREATKQEKIELGYDYDLEDGEKVENGKLVIVERPANLYRPVWDREFEEWKEGATKEDVLIERKNKLLEYKRLKNEVADLEELAELDEEFASPETIEMLRAKMDTLKAEIRELTKIAKNL